MLKVLIPNRGVVNGLLRTICQQPQYRSPYWHHGTSRVTESFTVCRSGEGGKKKKKKTLISLRCFAGRDLHEISFGKALPAAQCRCPTGLN